jgi:hypothetical protein
MVSVEKVRCVLQRHLCIYLFDESCFFVGLLVLPPIAWSHSLNLHLSESVVSVS